MPRLGASIYATRQGLADASSAFAISARLEELLQGWYDAGRLAGFRVRLALDQEDLDYHDFDPAIYGKYLDTGPPFLGINVTWDLESDRRPSESDMAAVIREFGLEHLADAAE
jgi:hypothetical protein